MKFLSTALVATLLLFAPFLSAATINYPVTYSTAWQTVGMQVVPSSSTAVISQTTQVNKLLLSNTSGSAVTVTVTDQSTNCSSAACKIVPTVSVGPNSVYVIDLGGVTANGGVKWVAGTASVIHGWMQGRY